MQGPPAGMARGQAPGGGKSSFRSGFAVFSIRNFRYLWVSSLFSFTGMQMQMVARALLAWELTKSFGAVGLISLSFGLPMLLLSLVGGSLADRFEKRNLTLGTQVATAVIALIHAAMLVTGVMTIPWLFVLGLFGGTAMALGMPARMPLTVQAVGPENLMSAMAMSNAAMNATRLFGPALAGVMVAAWSLESVYFLQFILYVFSCVTLLLVPAGLGHVARAPGAPARGSMFAEIGAGLRYVATDPRLRLLNIMMFVVAFFAMPYVMLLAGFVQGDLGKGESEFGFLQAVSGAGALVASVGLAALTGFERKPLIQWLCGIGSGLGLVALALGSVAFGFPGAIVATLLLGLALTAYQTLNSALAMDAAKPEYYGRVMSINMLSFSAMPLMSFPLGKLADVIGAVEMFTAQGLLVVAIMLLVGVTQPGHVFARIVPRGRPSMPGFGAAGRPLGARPELRVSPTED